MATQWVLSIGTQPNDSNDVKNKGVLFSDVPKDKPLHTSQLQSRNERCAHLLLATPLTSDRIAKFAFDYPYLVLGWEIAWMIAKDFYSLVMTKFLACIYSRVFFCSDCACFVG